VEDMKSTTINNINYDTNISRGIESIRKKLKDLKNLSLNELLNLQEEIEELLKTNKDPEFEEALKITREVIKNILSPNRIIIEEIKNNLKP
jgi:hypothetical protein